MLDGSKLGRHFVSFSSVINGVTHYLVRQSVRVESRPKAV